MAASKSIILLNGIAGFAATSLASLGVFEVGYKLKTTSVLSSGQNNPVYVEDEPQDYAERIDNLGIPDGCDTSCDLTAEQLRNLKFEQRSDSSAAYDGLKDGDTFELTVEEVSGDGENYPRGKKYILKAKTTAAEKITIRNLKGDDIVLGAEKGVEIREKEEGGWLEKVPEEVNGLGIPKRCETEESTPQTCELTKEQLQKLKFEPKDDQTSITVNGLTGDDKVSLTISEVTGDSKNYPHGKKYTLTSKTGKITIKGTKDGDIVLEGDKGVDFREKQSKGQLETVENSLGIPKSCAETCELTKEQLQRLKFETKGNEGISVEGLNDGTVELTIEDKKDDPTNYPQGKKYTLKTKTSGEVTIQNVKGGDIVLGEEGVAIRETNKGGKLEKTPEEVDALGIPKGCNSDQATAPTTQICELTKEQLERLKFEQKGNRGIRVDGLNDGETVELKVEKTVDLTNYPKGKKYILKSTSGQVTIWNVKEREIVLAANQDVAIRETSKGGKLEKVQEELDALGIPTRCKVGSPCQLTSEQLQRLTFETKTNGGTTISGLGSNDTVDLKVEDPYDTTNYPHNKKYTLKSKGGTVRIRGVKDGDIEIDTKQGVVIREKRDGGKLERAPEEVNDLEIPRRCITRPSCELTKEQLQRLKFEAKGKSPIWVSGMGKSDKVTLKVEDSRDKTNYPLDRKYTFISKKDGVTINGTKDGEIVLEKGKEVLVREKPTGGQLETVEDALGIPKGCNAEKVKRGSDPQTCELTADQLKNIKFKKINEKNAHVKVTGLTGKIKLTISWTENSSYPGNIKYSFDNTNLWHDDIKIAIVSQNEKKVIIAKKKESWFKNDGGQLEIVGAKTKSEAKTEEANEILKKLGLGKIWLIGSRDFTISVYSDKHNQKTVDFDSVDDLKKIQFKELGGGAEEVVGLSHKKIKVFFDWDENTSKFPYNMKFTFKNDQFTPYVELRKDGKSVQILKSAHNIFKVEKDQDKWYLVRSS